MNTQPNIDATNSPTCDRLSEEELSEVICSGRFAGKRSNKAVAMAQEIVEARSYSSRSTETIKTLCGALSRMLNMHELMMDKTNIHASFYDAECIFEMNKAPLQARKALMMAESPARQDSGLDDDIKHIIELLETGEWSENSAKTALASRLEMVITRAIKSGNAANTEENNTSPSTQSDYMEEAEVMERIGRRSKSALYNLRKKNNFPEPVLTYPSRYSRKAVEEWIIRGGINAAG